jgi:hypothetical protein
MTRPPANKRFQATRSASLRARLNRAVGRLPLLPKKTSIQLADENRRLPQNFN